ncbi:hypothetical protein LOTGIDRAFT_167887 [Lottia gigantea]|uniref:Uncharacterized protein n=1 Tax=Lottia gigantea TaxID=225164 RepID=V3ZRY4_LOTGI|nr:hypothetical protein LOTGIDRAFT_167887 [Lottia gigantea]ESO85310.1 hypothetical protein LOTGIDRAFT_167887 [Lottia gigantea]
MDDLNQGKKGISDNEVEDFLCEMKQPSLFDNTKFYRLRSRLVELVEEIKLKRVTERENEEKIRHLVHEKHELERKQESKQEEMLNLSDDHDHKLQEQKRHLDDQIHSLKEQVKKLQVHREVHDKEAKSLKDDIRSLQWTKYNLEKKLREQEHMLSAHHMSTDQHRNEMSTIEKKMAGMMAHYQHLADTLKRLELNGE